MRRKRNRKFNWASAIFIEFAALLGIVSIAQPETAAGFLGRTFAAAQHATQDGRLSTITHASDVANPNDEFVPTFADAVSDGTNSNLQWQSPLQFNRQQNGLSQSAARFPIHTRAADPRWREELGGQWGAARGVVFEDLNSQVGQDPHNGNYGVDRFARDENSIADPRRHGLYAHDRVSSVHENAQPYAYPPAGDQSSMRRYATHERVGQVELLQEPRITW